MILVDSSVWIDYFNGTDNPEASFLDEILGNEPVGTGDLMVAEVLQGFKSDAEFRTAKNLLAEITIIPVLQMHFIRQRIDRQKTQPTQLPNQRLLFRPCTLQQGWASLLETTHMTEMQN